MSRIGYLGKKTAYLVVEIWIALTLNFVLPRLMPGNPAKVLIARYLAQGVVFPPQTLKAFEAMFGLSTQPIYVQYIDYLTNTLTGNLGISMTYYPSSVASVIKMALPWDIALLGVATTISFIIGTLLGLVLGWTRGGRADSAVTTITSFLNDFPYFWIALGLLYTFSYVYKIFPVGQAYAVGMAPSISLKFIESYLYHAFLPAFTLILVSLGGWLLLTRNTAITNLSEDFMIYAESTGLSKRKLFLQYLGRNSILPSLTSFSISLGLIVGGALVTEIVFSYPGVGYVLYQAVLNDDYPLIQGIFFIITVVVLVTNYIVDLIYGFVDPRVGANEGT
ncbi:MAG: ABC transporter permease [Thermoprotei archaeon]